jgi:hypothetical protein
MALLEWVNVNPVLTVKLAKLSADAGPEVTLVLMIISSPAMGKPAGDHVMEPHAPDVTEVFTAPKEGVATHQSSPRSRNKRGDGEKVCGNRCSSFFISLRRVAGL